MTPVLCNVCRADPALQGVMYAAAIRSEPRCVTCGYLIDDRGEREPTDPPPAASSSRPR